MTEESKFSKRRTTGEVLERLQRLGIWVTPAMIADDTDAHYLPPRTTAHLGRAGASGLWEPWMERRAERLYRLRALDRGTRRGPSGNVLRLFLFFADGWGWEHVKETCIQGYRISVRGVMRGAKNRLRSQPLTLGNLHAVADDIAEAQYKPQDPNQAQIDRVRMTIGLVLFGVAPDSYIGTLERITHDLLPDAEPLIAAQFKQLAPLAWSMLAAGESEALRILDKEVSDAVMQRAIWDFRHLLWRTRVMFRRKIKPPDGMTEKRPSLNPLTGFGAASDFRFHKALRHMPIRATPAQYLGGQFAHSLVLAHRIEQMAQLVPFWLKWLAYWLQSEECAQWIQHMENEVRTSP